jgi:hypothetical protein
MTEAEWSACADPMPMLSFLNGKASDRKLRLFAVACVQRVLHLLPEEPYRRILQLAERYADGNAALKELAPFVDISPLDFTTYVPLDASRAFKAAAYAALGTVNPQFHRGGSAISKNAAIAIAWDAVGVAKRAAEAEAWATAWNTAEAAELGNQSDILRDLCKPFRPVSRDRALLRPDVIAVARQMYDDQAFQRMPELANVLEMAGCNNPDLLNHCRQPGIHVRGCWVVDRILDKE